MRIVSCFLIALVATILLTSCEHGVTSVTTVYPDGHLDKKFVFESKDSAGNILGLQRNKGWRKTVTLVDSTLSKRIKDVRYATTYEKSFASVENVNEELASANDTLLRVTSALDSKFRWFYTYTRYEETIHALNWLKLKPDDFLVQEDYAFIDRLPAEGKPMSKADDFFLTELNKRLYDEYGVRALFDEYMDLSTTIMAEHNIDQKWIDTLRAHKDNLFRKMKDEEIDMKELPRIMDSLGIPLDTAVLGPVFRSRFRLLEKKISFLSTASEGKYTYIVNLPGALNETNADSIAGNTVAWSPPPIKFLVKDYTMYGEYRTPNYIVWLFSGAIIAFTIYLLLRRRS